MIAVESLSVHQGTFALEGITFTIPSGEYAVLMGKTGCGKTTILEAICGLRRVAKGRIRILERDVTFLKPAERGVSYVPQDRALFPTLTVREHLAFALEIRRWDRKAIDQRVDELAHWLGIEPLLQRRPAGLSGGEAQRVAMGRALAHHPDILLLDEPLSALDEETRGEMIDLLRSIQERKEVTTLHVTHSRNEAKRLADRVLLLEDRQIRTIQLDERC